MCIPFKILTGSCKVHGVRTEVMPDGVSETECEASIEFIPLSKDSKVKAVVYLHTIADEDDATAAFVHDIESALNPICMELDNRVNVLESQTMTNSVNDGMTVSFFCVPDMKENGLKRNCSC